MVRLFSGIRTEGLSWYSDCYAPTRTALPLSSCSCLPCRRDPCRISNLGFAFSVSLIAPVRTILPLCSFVFLQLPDGDRDVVLSDAEKLAGADDGVGQGRLWGDDQVVDHADLLVLVVVHWLRRPSSRSLGAP